MTAQCFEIQIVGPMTATEIDHRGQHVANRRCGSWILRTPQADAALDRVTKPYGVSADGWLYLIEQIFANVSQIPWALIALDREYGLAGHFKSIKGLSREMIFTAYSLSRLRPGDPIKPRISMLIAFNKDIVARLAAATPLLVSAWETLRDKDEDKRWLCISDPLPGEWARQTEANDEHILAEFERNGQGLEQFRD